MSKKNKKLTPKQKREIRKAKKQASNEEKRPRLLQLPELNKKQPRLQKNPDSIMQLTI
ncbi:MULTISPECIES: hypothetical protein [Spirulina sp. CCY15215]|uniref:hypothetical protein n=1 Tax=Spirulina sp. CCY15215 TaxID=2767591 RepID=UPI00194FCF41|nr:hypothetical protein [Spirulina major]